MAVSKVGISVTGHTEEADGLLGQVSVRNKSFLDHESDGRLAGARNWVHLVWLGFTLQAMVGSLLCSETVSTTRKSKVSVLSKLCIVLQGA